MKNYNDMTTKELVEAYYDNFEFDSRLPNLFSLIEEEKLRKYIIGEFELYGIKIKNYSF